MRGITVKTTNSESSESQLKVDISKQPKGVYFVNLKAENGGLRSYKILLN